MNIDMALTDRWPAPVTIEVQIHYARGAPDFKLFSVEHCESGHAVTVFSPRIGMSPLEMHRIGWVDLPGRSLYQRCLSVLALQWFGSIDMVPRVRGAPLWRSLGVEMTMTSADIDRLKFDIQAVNDTSATLRYQFRRDQPLVNGVVQLDPLDADPLRALLRVGLARVKPMVAPRKAAAKPSIRPTSHADNKAHAPSPQA